MVAGFSPGWAEDTALRLFPGGGRRVPTASSARAATTAASSYVTAVGLLAVLARLDPASRICPTCLNRTRLVEERSACRRLPDRQRRYQDRPPPGEACGAPGCRVLQHSGPLRSPAYPQSQVVDP